MADSICTRCFHKDVCEQARENGHWVNKKCHYFNSRFVAADSVELVRHGHWVETIENGKMKRVTSCCGDDQTQLTTWYKPDYCPNCGAKMDKNLENGKTI